MKKNLKIAIFISDEGFGHVVRQRSIIIELLRNFKKINITVITSKKILVLNEYFGDRINYIKYNNKIYTAKKNNGDLDVSSSIKIFKNWKKNHYKIFNKFEKKFKNIDLIISDCVPEAFALAKKIGCKSIGISHFTWDWFYEDVCKINQKETHLMRNYLNLADKFYFPPFTQKKILKRYKNKIKHVNFIVNKFKKKNQLFSKKFKCLIMDNGTKNLSSLISETIPYLKKIDNCIFYIGTYSLKKKIVDQIIMSKNLVPVTGLKNMHSYIPSMDMIISRGGFNSITECITLKKPAMFVREENNFEVYSNIRNLLIKGVASIIRQSEWKKKFPNRFKKFREKEIYKIKKKLNSSSFKDNGANQIIIDIKKLLNIK
ncbi:glycosyltransferase [Candidatus Pelagibacter sp.]|nr:glycosyltransferase [Candidatus Pelagibacter sp.]